MRPRTTALTAVAAVALAPALVALGGLTAGPATATTGSQVCEGLSSGKIDTKGDPQSVTVYAPAGRLVAGYCVKAGSTKQGDGPVYALLATEVPSFVITHPSGKAVSHYSVWYVDEPTSTPEPTPEPDPRPRPSPSPSPRLNRTSR